MTAQMAESFRTGSVAKDKLRSIVDRIEKLEEEKTAIAGDIKEGFDTKILRKLISLRKRDAAEREDEQSVLETYMSALGMLPLFESRDGKA